ncbi:Biopolymer transport protein ExbB [Rosistilla oblonga]|uniref:Biopolymer transport protein ExbB n=1 Tax=Rosistilla oblonga TaxID=2527990 RepID=A0A518IUQ5_9BACT|nr:MotA/TolQ/ExbB proton channel family protein [Rosistilla oblonga]QDV15033.1 Biopolymer transport protein ExbB [Rosistilla oblonga]QDV56821.1 Biopolymer transport protein ExbB [Rosistilla oblonga]
MSAMLLAKADVYTMIANSIYFALAAVALWGIYCVVIVWTRVAAKRFKSEDIQNDYLDDMAEPLEAGDFEAVLELVEGDARAIPQMVELAVENRELGYQKVKALVIERFQRDVIADLEHRLSWISTVIKSAPMIGLFGTVFGMMGAFKTLATAESVDPTMLAADINVALRTTACGLAIAVPLIIATASVNIRISKMEDLVGAGLNRFFEAFRSGLSRPR